MGGGVVSTLGSGEEGALASARESRGAVAPWGGSPADGARQLRHCGPPTMEARAAAADAHAWGRWLRRLGALSTSSTAMGTSQAPRARANAVRRGTRHWILQCGA